MAMRFCGCFHDQTPGVCEECPPSGSPPPKKKNKRRCLKEIGLQFQIASTTLHLIVNKIFLGEGERRGESMCSYKVFNTHVCVWYVQQPNQGRFDFCWCLIIDLIMLHNTTYLIQTIFDSPFIFPSSISWYKKPPTLLASITKLYPSSTHLGKGIGSETLKGGAVVALEIP